MENNSKKFLILMSLFISIFSQRILTARETFFLLSNSTQETVLEIGDVNEKIPPSCTMTILLSLMGYDAKVLQDEKSPIWPFQEGYDDYFESWRTFQTPESWIRTSCVWYSEVLAKKLGLEKFQEYLQLFAYGNQEMSCSDPDLRESGKWLWDSSLKISPKEQASFIQKLVQETLPISTHAMQMTKSLHFKEELPEGWKLFGKTSLDLISEEEGEIAWFVGWIEKDEDIFIFAYIIRDMKVNASLRIPRVKQLLKDALQLDCKRIY